MLVMINIIYFLGELIGDDNNTRGVARNAAALYRDSGQAVTITEFKSSVENIEDARKLIISLDNTRDSIITISSGESGLAPLKALKASFGKKIFTSWSAHQLSGSMDFTILDQISLPLGVASHDVKVALGRKLIETVGIPHNLTRTDLESDYLAWKDKLAVTNKKKLVVILGGDAPNPEGKQLLYTTKEARHLAEYVVSLATKNDYYIYITNGPRTGRFNADTKKENKIAHRADIDITIPTDEVSTAFTQKLTAKGVMYHFIDFRYNSPSSFKALLKIADKVILPGESTSMISEASDFVDDITVYLTNSMNVNHFLSVEQIKLTRRIDVLDLTFKLKASLLPVSTYTEPAALTVAKGIRARIVELMFLREKLVLSHLKYQSAIK